VSVGFATFFAVVRRRQFFSNYNRFYYYKSTIAKIRFLPIQVLSYNDQRLPVWLSVVPLNLQATK
jgi:hypothetical protein